ncbi:MAG: chitobiase/beta-hexosaminidase C-terminal domain-containing protein [Cyclobacteriaceae bacterium]
MKRLFLVFTFVLSIHSFCQNLIISEFMAVNNATLQDEEGDYSDWIEIHNSGAESVSLQGWTLTDDAEDIKKWVFPAVSLAADSYLVVFASDGDKVDPAGTLHTNFKLSGSGEFLALVQPDGTTMATSFDPYPVQQADISYGLFQGQYISLAEPTPGLANSAEGFILDPVFSHERGFYDAGFDLILTDINSETNLYYTLNGSSPTLENATQYSGAITISKTTVLSVVAIDANEERGNVITQTYLFADVLEQPNNPEGYPSRWTSVEAPFYPGDYEMDPEICTEENKPQIYAALKGLPTVSLVTDIAHLFRDEPDVDSLAGIYLNSVEHSEDWERPASFEYFDPTDGAGFQINCGLRVHGGNGRKPGNSPKHSLRVHFRSKYGPSKLNFNMFSEKSATNEFNALVFRAGYNYSWVKNNPAQCEGTDYIRDPFTKKTQLDMGRTAAHRKFAHLYLNGLYWGVFDISEKITNDFAEAYLDGDEDDFDVVKDHNGVTDGTIDAWNELLSAVEGGFETNEKYFKVQGKNEDGSDNDLYSDLLDVRNLTDYMLINFYIANGDWDRNNWLTVRNRVSNEEGFKFFCWDAETSMNALDDDITDINNPGNPSAIFNKLLENEEYRLYLADRIQKHFFNRGDLTTEATLKRYTEIADELQGAMVAESARWGDYRRDVDGGESYDIYTVEDHWLPRLDFMKETYLPQRTDVVVDQLKEMGFYPEVDAPVLSEHGGDFTEPISVTITADADMIYYTTDDTDPRALGGNVSASASLYEGSIGVFTDMTVQARAKKDGKWSALTKTNFDVESGDVTIVNQTVCQGEEYLGFTNSGTHIIQEKAKNGEDSIVAVVLKVNALPQFSIGNDTTLLHDATLTLQADSDYETYLWSTGETSQSIQVSGWELGKYSYWLQAHDANGCSNADTINVDVIWNEAVLGNSLVQDFKIFPNPTTDKILVSFPMDEVAKVAIQITALNGSLVYKNELTTDVVNEEISLSHVSKGLYIVNIRTGKFEKSYELIKR